MKWIAFDRAFVPRVVPRIFPFLFYAIILSWILLAKPPVADPQNYLQRGKFAFWDPRGIPYPGSEFAVYKPYLPEHGTVSFLSDIPYHPYAPAAEQLYAAQSYLVPLLLSAFPGEKEMMVYCSRGDIAEGWMLYTGYRPKVILGDGQCLAVKIS